MHHRLMRQRREFIREKDDLPRDKTNLSQTLHGLDDVLSMSIDQLYYN